MWPNVPGYIGACLDELASRGVKLLVIQDYDLNESNKVNVYKEKSNINLISLNKKSYSLNQLRSLIQTFNPDISLISLSYNGIRFEIAKFLNKNSKIVIGAVDAYKKNTVTEEFSHLLFKFFARKYYDAVWVPGYRGSLYAKESGFYNNVIFEGVYTCDTNIFMPIGRNRLYEFEKWPQVFLYIGQYIERKGFDLLIQSYKQYRKNNNNPWELWCIGDGPLKPLVTSIEGITDFGIQNSLQCAEMMSKSGAFILPSREDHWPLVLHEAGSCGLPILASVNCGNVVELVYNGISGVTYSPAVNELKNALNYVSSNLPEKMGFESYRIAQKYSVEKWADLLLYFIPHFLLSTKSFNS